MTKGLLLVGPAMTLASCGGSEDEARDIQQAQTEPSTSVAPAVLDAVDADLRRLGKLADAEDCSKASSIRKAIRQLRFSTGMLGSTEDDPRIDDIQSDIRSILADSREALNACRESQELQSYADELREKADEIGRLGE